MCNIPKRWTKHSTLNSKRAIDNPNLKSSQNDEHLLAFIHTFMDNKVKGTIKLHFFHFWFAGTSSSYSHTLFCSIRGNSETVGLWFWCLSSKVIIKQCRYELSYLPSRLPPFSMRGLSRVRILFWLRIWD